MKLFDVLIGEDETQDDVRETVLSMLRNIVPPETISVTKPNRQCHAVVVVRDSRYGNSVANALYA